MNSEKVYSKIGQMAGLYDFCLSVIGYEKSVNYFISQLSFAKSDSIKALDAGCGTGLYSLALLKRYENANVTAFDFNRKLIEHFKEKVWEKKLNNRTHLFTADIQSSLSEIENEKFNLIITAGVLEYVPQEKTIRNLSRFLISGGYFFSSPVRDTAWGRFICKLYACKPYSKIQNIRMFQKNGFTLHKIIEVPRNPSASFKEAHVFKKL